jgi:hypothetical protein
MPRSQRAPRSVSAAKPPYAASTWNQTPVSSQTSATASRWSIVPVFVAPADAETSSGRRPAARSAAIACARMSGRIRNSSSTGRMRTCSGRKPSTRAARATDEWACAETYATTSAVIAPSRASRAQASAVRFAADPPETSTPAAPAGYPIQSANQRTTSSSTWLGPADSIHAPA